MPYHTIAVHLDDVDKAPELLKVASKLADEHNSHLIGLFIMHPLELYVARMSEASFSKNISDIINKDQLERMQKLKELFTTQTNNQNYESEWRFVENKNDSVFEILMKQAATTDLLVLGNDRSTINKTGNDILIEKVLLDSPVPTLVVPDGFQGEILGRNVMIGWDATAVSRRAITGAISFLKVAENAWLHRVTDENGEDHFHHSVEIEMASMLARHEVKVELSTSAGSSPSSAGKSLLEEATLRGADMLVAGAFGHPRIRNIILGSTTKYLLNHSELPLLMTH